MILSLVVFYNHRIVDTQEVITEKPRSKSILPRIKSKCKSDNNELKLNMKRSFIDLRLFAKSEKNITQRMRNQVNNYYDYKEIEKTVRKIDHDELKKNMIAIFERYKLVSEKTGEIEDLMQTDILFKKIQIMLDSKKYYALQCAKHSAKIKDENFNEKLKKMNEQLINEPELPQKIKQKKRNTKEPQEVKDKLELPIEKTKGSPKKNVSTINKEEVTQNITQKTHTLIKSKVPLNNTAKRNIKGRQQQYRTNKIVREESGEITPSTGISRNQSKNIAQLVTKMEDKAKLAELEKKKEVMSELAKAAVKNMKEKMSMTSEEKKENCGNFNHEY